MRARAFFASIAERGRAFAAKLIPDQDEVRLVVSELREEFRPIPPEAERRMIGPELGELDVFEAARITDEDLAD